jgi:Ras-related protein Rab-7A
MSRDLWQLHYPQDAIILIFDINQPETLRSLNRYWSEFWASRPLSDEEIEEYCLVVVGTRPAVGIPIQ